MKLSIIPVLYYIIGTAIIIVLALMYSRNSNIELFLIKIQSGSYLSKFINTEYKALIFQNILICIFTYILSYLGITIFELLGKIKGSIFVLFLLWIIHLIINAVLGIFGIIGISNYSPGYLMVFNVYGEQNILTYIKPLMVTIIMMITLFYLNNIKKDYF